MRTTTARAARQPLPLWRKVAYSLLPLAAVLLVAECATQLSRGAVLANYRLMRIELLKRGLPGERHPDLGYAPIPGYASQDNHWGTQVTIDADGYRENGRGERPEGAWILTTGDSFTFGDEVSDQETWPARLEGELGRPVLNGGVFGYSLGQSVLRGEAMLRRHPDADWLIVSLIEDDIRRCEFSRRFTDKPWFSIEGGALTLHRNDGSRNPPTPEELASRRWRDLLGRSALLDALFAHGTEEMKHWWFIHDKVIRAHPAGAGREIAVLLADRIQAACAASGIRLMFVLQGRDLSEPAQALLEHLERRRVPTLDLVTPFFALRGEDPGIEDRFYDSHMTAEGNAWVAHQIAAFLRAQE